MSKIGLIISREYRNRVVKKSFLWMTFLTPVLMAALIVVPIWLASIKDDEDRVVAVVDQTGLYVELFEGLECEDCVFEVVDEAPELRFDTSIFPEESEYMAFVIIDDDLSVGTNAVTIYSQKQFPSSVRRFIESALENYVEEQKLASYNIPKLKEMIDDARVDVRAKTYKLSDEGVTTSDSDIASIVGILATMLIYMFIFVSGSQVMNSVVQEKVNRIVEVMVCSVRPWELMWGKIIAVGLTCLTQMVLWAVLTMMIVGVAMGVMGIDMSGLQGGPAAGMAVEMQEMSALGEHFEVLWSIDWGFVAVMFLVYFVGGYLLYSSMFAAIGASVDNESDTSQFMTPITIIVLFALYAGMYSAENPDGPLAFWCSMIPFTSPIVMMVRVPFDVPVWQLGLSLGLLALTIVGNIWLSAKIYRVGILMYGKKPTVKEIIKWIKYK
ncbi:MAG: ABC transporter permease [Paludibacteraceae bacterium]|nr:ABC transporter permease [Paludibacteraceae bacterium]